MILTAAYDRDRDDPNRYYQPDTMDESKTANEADVSFDRFTDSQPIANTLIDTASSAEQIPVPDIEIGDLQVIPTNPAELE